MNQTTPENTSSFFSWSDHLPQAVTVCDTEGRIIAMNRASAALFKNSGGTALIGASLFSCHPQSANAIIKDLLRTQRTNTYITEKKDKRLLVHQAPWYNDNEFAGLVETITVLSGEIVVKKGK